MRSVTLAFLSGILIQQQMPELWHPLWGLIPIVLIPVAFRYPLLRWPLAMALGFFWMLWQAHGTLSQRLLPQDESRNLRVSGVVSTVPIKMSRGWRFRFRITRMEDQDVDLPVRLTWYQHSEKPLVGERWQWTVRLKRPGGSQNPGGRDQAAWWFSQGISATGYVRHDPPPQRLAMTTDYPLERWREGLLDTLSPVLVEHSQHALLLALATGDRSQMTPSQWQVLARTGTGHLMAISGLHLGLIAALFFWLGQRVWRYTGLPLTHWPAQKFGACSGVAAALFYAVLSGFSLPAQRALIMITVVMLVWLWRGKTPVSYSLSLALFIILLWDPAATLTAGLWLSFGAVAILALMLRGRHAQLSGWWRVVWWQLMLTIALAPLLLILFQQTSVISPVANLLAIPLMAVLLPFILLLTVISPLGGSEVWLLVNWPLEQLWQILQWFSQQSWSVWQQAIPAGWIWGTTLVGVVLLILPGLGGARIMALIWLLPVIWVKPERPAVGEVWFSVLDVGQGLSAVVQTANHTLVYDAGAKYSSGFSMGSAVVAPFLRHQGIKAVDHLMISHGDQDHAGGVRGLLDHVLVRQISTSVVPKMRRLAGEDVPVIGCQAGQYWEWDGVVFRVLHPSTQRESVGNNASCVLRIETHHQRFLLTGDIEKKAEKSLLKRDVNLRSSVLVAPHHGSRTSSTDSFIQAVDPDWVIFSSGYRNRFHHPAAEVMARYQQFQVSVLNTSCDGAIIIRSGESLEVQRWRRHTRRYWYRRCLG
jgi:competence protein ComEC